MKNEIINNFLDTQKIDEYSSRDLLLYCQKSKIKLPLYPNRSQIINSIISQQKINKIPLDNINNKKTKFFREIVNNLTTPKIDKNSNSIVTPLFNDDNSNFSPKIEKKTLINSPNQNSQIPQKNDFINENINFNQYIFLIIFCLIVLFFHFFVTFLNSK